jgi:UDP-N-acetyl-D-glucosamine dehydrogenase
MFDKINYKKNSISRLKSKQARIGVIGLGYVGLPLAILFAKKGFKIFGFDIDKYKINRIKNKKTYIERISPKDINLLSGRNKCFSNFNQIKNCDVIIICVPTPLVGLNKPDLSYIKKTIASISKQLKFGQTIILESTSYPGTTQDEIIKRLDKKFVIGKNLFVGFSSERINPGVNENMLSTIPKVISGKTINCLNVVTNVYSKVFKKVVKAKSLEIAEFSKLLENIYRAVNIGFINEMKFVADKMKIDIFEILKIAGTKPYGFRRFNPGPGIGGHCIPIDPHYLFWKAKKVGISANFIKLAAETNSNVIKFIMTKILRITKETKINRVRAKILILGLAYKKNVDDIRESASLKLIKSLQKKNMKNLTYCDPHTKNIKLPHDIKKIKKLNSLTKKNIKKFDVVVLMTDHDKFRYKDILSASKKIVDCRGRFPISQKVYRA